MKKIVVYLNGGLGNQMFQYATARALSRRTGAELVVDSWSGFVRDTQYRRDYELDGLPIHARVATVWERVPIWLFRAENRIRGQGQALFQRRFYGQFLVETELAYQQAITQIDFESSAYLVGYWQSPMYFQDCAKTLRSELMPPPPQQERFVELGQSLKNTESVSLGIRLYEESANPGAHAKDGQLKTVAEVNGAISRVRTARPNAQFFVFCTHRSPILDELELPSKTTFVTHDDGYEGTLERLWLLAQCKHHIFTNSSYYWWGAWLSGDVYGRSAEPQHILAADNFINRDGFCPDWDQF